MSCIKNFLLIYTIINHCVIYNQNFGQFGPISRFSYGPDERRAVFNIRLISGYLRALMQPSNYIFLMHNEDEKNVADYAAQFSKSFEHDQNGILTADGKKSYQQLVKALSAGKQEDFNAIVRAPGAGMKLVNPQAAFAFSLEGCDSSLFVLPNFPTLISPEIAASMIELYLMALCRDVRFDEYGTSQGSDAHGIGGSLTHDAAVVLESLGNAYRGPRNQLSKVDVTVLFRGNLAGDLIGPYTSQFALLPLKTAIPKSLGGNNLSPVPLIKLDQQWAIASQREFGVSLNDYVSLQNGKIPKLYTINDYDQFNKRYIINGRDWASFIHTDINCESFLYAACILNGFGFPYSSALPYNGKMMPNESAFATMGMMEMFAMLEGVTSCAIKACWAQKWRTHRVLRPEAFAGLVHFAVSNNANPYNLHNSLFVEHAGMNVLTRILEKNTFQANFPDNQFTSEQAMTYLLSQTYPEGSPVHPSYPSGHAAVAGACATILKAFFEDVLISSIIPPVEPNPTNPTQLIPLADGTQNKLTISGELNKLASNNSYSRNWAGIHWREDAHEGILLGEKVAIRYLQDCAMLYSEQNFNGYSLTKFDGKKIKITALELIEL